MGRLFLLQKNKHSRHSELCFIYLTRLCLAFFRFNNEYNDGQNRHDGHFKHCFNGIKGNLPCLLSSINM